MAPAKKRAYPFRLRLCDNGNRFVLLPLYRQSHIRIDLEYEVPINVLINVLEQVVDHWGFPYMLLLRTCGSIRHLCGFLRQRADKQASLEFSAALHNIEEQPLQIQGNVLSHEVEPSPNNAQPPLRPYHLSVASCLLISSCIVALPLILLIRRWRKK
jgi:hypothetical protein